MLIKFKRIKKTDKQKEFDELFKNHKRIVIPAGRRSGKTEIEMEKLCLKLFQQKTLLYALPTPAGLDVVYRKLWKKLHKFIDARYIQYNKTAKEFYFKDGFIKLQSLQVPAVARGSEDYDYIFVDECQAFEEAGLDGEAIIQGNLLPTLAKKNGSLILSGTATPRTTFQEYHKLTNEPESKWVTVPDWTSYTNQYLHPSAIDEIAEDMDQVRFQNEIMALFIERNTAMFKEENFEFVNSYDEIKHKVVKITIGVDPAISTKDYADYTAIVVLAKCSDNTFVVLEANRYRIGAFATADKIEELFLKWEADEVVIEKVAYQQALEEIVRKLKTKIKVILFEPNKHGDKVQRASVVNASFERKRMYFLTENEREFNREFTRELLVFPRKKEHDDYVDALSSAYIVSKKAPTRAY